MFNPSLLLANAYSPVFNLAQAYCTVNGKPVACPDFSVFMPFFAIFMIFWLVFVILVIAGMWKVFEKAGQKGWKSIIPIYNYIILLRMIKKPEWWVLFLFVPIVNIVVPFIILYHLAKAFNKDVGFMFGMAFLPFIFYPILGFGTATYTAPMEPQKTM